MKNFLDESDSHLISIPQEPMDGGVCANHGYDPDYPPRIPSFRVRVFNALTYAATHPIESVPKWVLPFLNKPDN